MNSLSVWVGVVQFLVIAAVVWLFYARFIRGGHSEKFVRGLIGLAAMWVGSWVLTKLELNILGLFMHWVAMFLSIGLVVIFQPELRKFLGMMGQIKFLRALVSKRALSDITERDKRNRAATEVTKAVEYMSRTRTGALIVFRDTPDGTIENMGTMLNADISSELLLTIFFNKTPLHDGAVIVSRSRIVSAGAILPLSDNGKLNWKYGTRHRAAIGMTEDSEASVLVVSEETGEISIAHNGTIKKCDAKNLRAALDCAMGVAPAA